MRVYRLKRYFFWLKVKKKLHIVWQSEQVSIATYIVVTEFDEMLHTVFLWVFSDGGEAFGLGASGFYLDRDTLAVVSDEKIQFQAGVLLEII